MSNTKAENTRQFDCHTKGGSFCYISNYRTEAIKSGFCQIRMIEKIQSVIYNTLFVCLIPVSYKPGFVPIRLIRRRSTTYYLRLKLSTLYRIDCDIAHGRAGGHGLPTGLM